MAIISLALCGPRGPICILTPHKTHTKYETYTTRPNQRAQLRPNDRTQQSAIGCNPFHSEAPRIVGLNVAHVLLLIVNTNSQQIVCVSRRHILSIRGRRQRVWCSIKWSEYIGGDGVYGYGVGMRWGADHGNN